MRSTYFSFSLVDGFLMARLQLTPDEAAPRSDLTTVAPPAETVDERAWFDAEANTWALVPR